MHERCVKNKQVDYQLLSTDSGQVFANRFANADAGSYIVNFTLPDNAAQGVFFTFGDQDRYSRIRIIPGNVLDTIIDPYVTPSSGQSIISNEWYTNNGYSLVSDGNRRWLLMGSFGSWGTSI